MKRDKMTTIVYKSQQENEILGNTNPTGYRGELGCSRRVAVTDSLLMLEYLCLLFYVVCIVMHNSRQNQ